jgi:hypothetical protein
MMEHFWTAWTGKEESERSNACQMSSPSAREGCTPGKQQEIEVDTSWTTHF